MASKRENNYYTDRVVPNWSKIQEWARANASNQEIASALGFTKATLDRYIKEHDDFRNMLNEARMAGIPEIKAALYRRAVGYEYVETRTLIKKDEEGTPREYTEVYKKRAHPDPTAIAMYLRNNTDTWRDKDSFYEKCKKEELKMAQERLEKDNF